MESLRRRRYNWTTIRHARIELSPFSWIQQKIMSNLQNLWASPEVPPDQLWRGTSRLAMLFRFLQLIIIASLHWFKAELRRQRQFSFINNLSHSVIDIYQFKTNVSKNRCFPLMHVTHFGKHNKTPRINKLLNRAGNISCMIWNNVLPSQTLSDQRPQLYPWCSAVGLGNDA